MAPTCFERLQQGSNTSLTLLRNPQIPDNKISQWNVPAGHNLDEIECSCIEIEGLWDLEATSDWVKWKMQWPKPIVSWIWPECNIKRPLKTKNLSILSFLQFLLEQMQCAPGPRFSTANLTGKYGTCHCIWNKRGSAAAVLNILLYSPLQFRASGWSMQEKQ